MRASSRVGVALRPFSPSTVPSLYGRTRNSTRAKATVANTSLSIMPLGGSVTYGMGSSDGNGYRERLRQLLVADGYSVRMVGCRKAGEAENNENEGWRGYRIDQITDKARRAVATFRPDLFLVNAGSNDCVQDFHVDTARQRLESLLDILWASHPHAAIGLSTLLPNRNPDIASRVSRVNSQILALAEASSSKRLFLVDFHTHQGPQAAELPDGTHPDDNGYAKMADLWYTAIREFWQA